MNNLQVFNNEEFGQVRFLEIEGKTYAVASDIAKVLGYVDPYDAIKRHTKGSVKHLVLTNGGEQELKVIPEGDIYRLIIRSNLKTAERFECWIFDEVLPSIRKNGAYLAQQSNTSIPQTTPEALRLAADLLEENSRLLPKAQAYDTFMESEGLQTISQVAKVLGTGRNRLFELLRDLDVIYRDWYGGYGPYQKYVNAGYFKLKEKVVTKGNCSCVAYVYTLVTPKGINFIHRILKEA